MRTKQTTNKNPQSSLYERSIKTARRNEKERQKEINSRMDTANQKFMSKESETLLRKFAGANDDLKRRNPQKRKPPRTLLHG